MNLPALGQGWPTRDGCESNAAEYDSRFSPSLVTMAFLIDVVIPTFGNWELTERCLRHLQAQTVGHTVTVADNGSPDATPERIRTSFPEVRVIELGANLGFTVACNRGAASGDGDVIVLVNND